MINIEKELKKYKEKGFNEEQLLEIKTGLKNGLTKEQVESYAILDLPGCEMLDIRYAIEHEFPSEIIALMIKRKFDFLQFQEIMSGHNKGLDICWYANPDFDYQQMEQIRLGLENDLDVSLYAKPKFTKTEMNTIYNYLLARKKAGLND